VGGFLQVAVSEAPSQSACELELLRVGAPDTALRLRGTYQELVGASGCTAFDYRLQVWAQIFDVRGVITGCSLFWEKSH
jgi:hypothetical protein